VSFTGFGLPGSDGGETKQIALLLNLLDCH